MDSLLRIFWWFVSVEGIWFGYKFLLPEVKKMSRRDKAIRIIRIGISVYVFWFCFKHFFPDDGYY